MNKLSVKKVSRSEFCTMVELEDGSTVKLRPFVYITKGDALEFMPSLSRFDSIDKIFLDPDTKETRRVRVHPPYSEREMIFLGSHRFEVLIRERMSDEDWKKVKQLEHFHYRGKTFNKIVGRRTALLAEIDGIGIVGFGILSATVAAARPRFELLETDFTHQMRSKLINRIARIPRVVIHPEFRGIGLGAVLARHLVQYAKSYWDINHYTPMMVEVIAAMTEYHKFFEEAGFVRIGYTSGYRNGIIPRYGNGSFESRTNHEKYDFMRDQKPKPYLVFPLNQEMELRIRRYQKKPTPVIQPRLPILREPIRLENVSVKYKIQNGTTLRTETIKEVFGVDAEHAFFPVFNNLSLEIQPGDTMLVTGASGSGKSTLIKLLTPRAMNSNIEINGSISQIENSVAILNTRHYEPLPLIDQVAKDGNIKEAIDILNSVGLSEAHLYIKRPQQISDGQRYRFAVAQLCDSKKPVWVADEFASTLNPETAAIVARGLRKIAYKRGATLILSAPHVDSFIKALVPTKLLRLRWGGEVILYSVRVIAQQQGTSVSLTIENNGELGLTGVETGLLLKNGLFNRQNVFPYLAPRKSIVTSVEINVNASQLYAVMVVTAEGIGELFYRE